MKRLSRERETGIDPRSGQTKVVKTGSDSFIVKRSATGVNHNNSYDVADTDQFIENNIPNILSRLNNAFRAG